MEAVSTPRESSPDVAVIVVPSTSSSSVPGRKRKHAVLNAASAHSPAPSDRGNTPAPPTENIVLPARYLDLSTRPRLTISRHPSFIPIAPGSEYHTTEPLCNNRLNFRYTPAGLANPGSVLPFRAIESEPTQLRVSWEDRSVFIKVTKDGLGLRGEKGFRSARCNAPVREGKWFLEVRIEQGGGDRPPEGSRLEGSHVRLGWARREAPLNAPAGLDGYSYAIRDKTGEKVHLSRPRRYGRPFKTGDVVGMYISLPSRRLPNPKDDQDPAHIKRERIAIEFKGQEYFESFEYSQSKEMIALMNSNERGKGNTSTPATSSTKKSATVKNLPSTSRGVKSGSPEPESLRPLPTLGSDSYTAFFINGEPQGIAFQDLYDYIPLRPRSTKMQEKKRANKEGLREHKENLFDDGSLGYYPFISLFNEARVRINPGPNFEFPPPPDIDSVLAAGHEDVKPPINPTWRPLCERYPEYMAEQFALDDKEEGEAQAQQQNLDAQEMAQNEKLEKHREKRRQQAAARKERKKKDKDDFDPKRPLKRSRGPESNINISLDEVGPDTNEGPYLGLATVSGVLPTFMMELTTRPRAPGHDNSEYNTDADDGYEEESAPPDGDAEMKLEDELAAAAGVD